MAQNTATLSAESTAVLKELENKMSGIMGVIDTLSRKVDETNDMFVSTDSAYFLNMSSAISSSLHESEMDRRLYEEAMEQNRMARGMSTGSSPERGDANFWEQAFAPTPVSPAEVQANALKATFSDSSVMDAFKNMLGGVTQKDDAKSMNDIIQEALRGNADDRTLGEKFLDKVGLGGITKIKNWWADRDIRKEEKATAKDQGTIKREQKQIDRLSAKFRKMKASGASEDELREVQDDLIGHQLTQADAANRIQERRNTDLSELGEPNKPGTGISPENLMGFYKGGTEYFSKVSTGKFMDELKDVVGTAFKKTQQDIARIREVMDIQGKMDTKTRPEFYTAGTTTFNKINSGKLLDEFTSALGDSEDSDGSRGGDGSSSTLRSIKSSAEKLETEIVKVREILDIQRRLDTRMRPDFYKAGTVSFKKVNSGALADEIANAIGDSGGGPGILGGLKGGLYAAAAVAVGASAAKIGQAVSLVKDWYNASNEAVENVKKMTEQNNANLEKRKNGVNDDMLTATQESNTAAQELHESEDSWADSAGSFIKDTMFGGLFGKSDRKKAQEKAAAAEKKRQEELKKYGALRDAAKQAGVDINDVEAMKKFKSEYDKEQAAHKNAAKLAMGNLQESGQQQTAQTPGAKAEPDKAVTAQEQAKLQEEAMYNATKRALLDNDVQRQNEENAKIQGQQIDRSLNGRK